VKTALTVLPATVGIVAGNAIGMPLAPKLGRQLPMVGVVVLLAGTASTLFVVTRFGLDLSPWHMMVPILLLGASLVVGLGLFTVALVACFLLPTKLAPP
jgi:hypothetical protein